GLDVGLELKRRLVEIVHHLLELAVGDRAGLVEQLEVVGGQVVRILDLGSQLGRGGLTVLERVRRAAVDLLRRGSGWNVVVLHPRAEVGVPAEDEQQRDAEHHDARAMPRAHGTSERKTTRGAGTSRLLDVALVGDQSPSWAISSGVRPAAAAMS